MTTQSQDYIISFYFYIFCDICEDDNDFFRIIINDGDSDNQLIKEYSYNNIEKQKIWINERIDIKNYRIDTLEVKFIYFIFICYFYFFH